MSRLQELVCVPEGRRRSSSHLQLDKKGLISEQRDEKLSSAGGAQKDLLDPSSILVSVLTW